LSTKNQNQNQNQNQNKNKQQNQNQNHSHYDSYPSPLHSIHVIEHHLSVSETSNILQMSKDHAWNSGCWSTMKTTKTAFNDNNNNNNNNKEEEEEEENVNEYDSPRHVTYPTVDFAVEECLPLEEYLASIQFQSRTFGMLERLYGIPMNNMDFLDLFVVQYRAKEQQQQQEEERGVHNSYQYDNETMNDDDKEDETIMDRLEAHRDGSLLSFTILLNDPSQFVGGGTIFDALRDVVDDSTNTINNEKYSDTDSVGTLDSDSDSDSDSVRTLDTDMDTDMDTNVLLPGGVIRVNHGGDAIMHCGKILHGGNVITSGTRVVLVGFVDIEEDRCVRKGVMKTAAREWGRVDVAEKQLQYYDNHHHCKSKNKKGENGSCSTFGGLFRKGGGTGHSRLLIDHGRYVPKFTSVQKRGDSEYRRQKKLMIEDLLLRSALLSENERQVEATARAEALERAKAHFNPNLFDGDITLL